MSEAMKEAMQPNEPLPVTDRVEKTKAVSTTTADAAADIELINRYAKTPLAPEKVYCFSVNACDNEVDRDNDYFTDKSLEVMAKLFTGKTVIFDHYRTAENQFARIYRCEVEEADGETLYGAKMKVLRADIYMLNNEANAATIEAIEGGILKEVSVGLLLGEYNCSLCHKALHFQWETWSYKCDEGHVKGMEYKEGRCLGLMEKPKDAYELSFVAVPCQRNAGVRKGAHDPEIDNAFILLTTANLSEYPEQVKALIPNLKKAFTDSAEREARQRIIEENKQFLLEKGD